MIKNSMPVLAHHLLHISTVHSSVWPAKPNGTIPQELASSALTTHNGMQLLTNVNAKRATSLLAMDHASHVKLLMVGITKLRLVSIVLMELLIMPLLENVHALHKNLISIKPTTVFLATPHGILLPRLASSAQLILPGTPPLRHAIAARDSSLMLLENALSAKLPTDGMPKIKHVLLVPMELLTTQHLENASVKHLNHTWMLTESVYLATLPGMPPPRPAKSAHLELYGIQPKRLASRDAPILWLLESANAQFQVQC